MCIDSVLRSIIGPNTWLRIRALQVVEGFIVPSHCLRVCNSQPVDGKETFSTIDLFCYKWYYLKSYELDILSQSRITYVSLNKAHFFPFLYKPYGTW